MTETWVLQSKVFIVQFTEGKKKNYTFWELNNATDEDTNDLNLPFTAV